MIKKIDDIIKEQFDSVSEDLGFPVMKDFLGPDTKQEIIKNMFTRKFDNISKAESDSIKNILIKAFDEGMPMKDLAIEIEKIAPRLTKADISRIVQTENTSIVNTAREKAFKQTDPEGTRLYKWVSIPDKRRTEICENITSKSASGLPMDALRKLVHKEGKKGGFEPREWVPHINCRSVMVQAR